MDAEANRPVLRRPLVGLAACFVSGTWCGLVWSVPLPAGLGAAAACLVLYAGCDLAAWRLARQGPDAALRARGWGRAATLGLLVCALLIGWISAALRVHEPRDRLLRTLMQKPREGVELLGVVRDDPAVRPDRSGAGSSWILTLEAEGVQRTGAWQPARGRVAVTLKAGESSGPPPRYGERWRLFGVLTDASRHPPPEGGGRRPAWEWVGLPYRFQGAAADAARLAEGQGNPLLALAYRARRQGGRLLGLGLERQPDVAGLLQALLLGYRQELSPRLRDVFMVTGTFHVFAISGQHVMIVALFFIFILQVHGVSRVRWFLALAPVLIFYTLATGMSASALRGCIMVLALYAGPLVLRKPDLPSAMALAAVLILALDPAQLPDRGFLLSFLAVAGLMTMYPALAGRMLVGVRPDAFQLEPEPRTESEPEPGPEWVRGARRRLRRAGISMVQLLAASLAAWLATAPLGARWFHLVSVIGIVANLLVVPAVGLVLAVGFLSMLTGWLVPALGLAFNWVNLAVITLVVEAVSGMAKLPGGYAYVQAPPWWFVAGWYGSILAWLSGRGRSRRWLLAPAALAALTAAAWWWHRHEVILEVVHPGQRPVLFVNGPGAHDWLVDSGPRFQAYALRRLLAERGVDGLDWVLVTRLVASHAGAAAEGLGAVRVGSLAVPRGGQLGSPTGQALTTLALAKKAPVLALADGMAGAIGGAAMNWEVLYPPADAVPRGDQAVLVLRLVCRETVVLVRGDASPAVEEALLRQPARLKADVLILLDPAAAAACTTPFLEAVSPRLVVAAGSPPDRLAACPAAEVAGLEPREGLRLNRRGRDWRLERFRLEP